MASALDRLVAGVASACQDHYGSRLRALAVFGSVGRGTPRHDSDIDLLLVIDGLPNGRLARVDDFTLVEQVVRASLDDARAAGLSPALSPVFKTPAELAQGSLLLLDMTEDARILFDPDGLLASVLDRLASRLRELGAKRRWRGSAWLWDLKPDYRPGEVFEL